MTALLLAAVVSVATPADDAYRAALDLVYDGAFAASLAKLEALSSAQADDPLGVYLRALALCWVLEQRPESTEQDREFLRLVDRALALASVRLARDPEDARARLGRGAAYAVRSRFHMFRQRRSEAARDAVHMREELLGTVALGVESGDALFGLGLYDYYADVLPRFAKFLRFLAGMPGGNRERGLGRIEEAQDRTLFHGTEARVQLYEIYAFYEDKPDRAGEQIAELHARYPGWPLWGLKLAEHLRDRMGLYAEAAAVAREIRETAQSGRHPNYQPVVAAMASVSLGQSLLLDLRFAEAREALLPAREGSPQAPSLAGQARLLLGRSLELEGDRHAALAHYRPAAASPNREIRRAAQAALAEPLPRGEVRGAQLLARARRRREEGQDKEAAVLYRDALNAWPKSREAALFVAEDELRQGQMKAAEHLAALLRDKDPSPPWVRPWAQLLEAERQEREGEHGDAVQAYKRVFEEPCGQPRLRERAADGLRRLLPRAAPSPSGPSSGYHPK